MAEQTYGGQAVIEGVMVKSKKNMAVAVRKPNGKIAIRKEKLNPISERVYLFSLPFFRGMAMLFEILFLGMKALNFSASQASGEEDKASNTEIFFTVLISIVMALLIFKLIPLFATQQISKWLTGIGQGFLFNLIEGLLKLGVFVLYIWLISQMKDVKRLFMYHGAEHMSIACHEQGKALAPKNVRKYSPIHRRCGTTFLFIVIFLSILVYSFVPAYFGFWEKFLWRILLLPVIAGIAYEILKLGAKFDWLINIMVQPGLWIQKMTTAVPDNKQIEVAIASMKAVISMEKSPGKARKANS